MTWEDDEVSAAGSPAAQEERKRRYRIVTRVPTLTSLIDIVFLMLTFFVVTATIAPREQQLGASTPSHAAKGLQPKPDLDLLDPAKIDVEIAVTGEGDAFGITLNGRALGSLQDLFNLLKGLQGDDALTGTQSPRVRIAGSDSVRYKYVLYVLNTVHKAGFEDITLESK